MGIARHEKSGRSTWGGKRRGDAGKLKACPTSDPLWDMLQLVQTPMTLDLQHVARAMNAVGDVPAIPVAGWSVDTRTQNIGDVYFALRGPNHDGHDYVANARAKGAAAVVVERSTGVPGELVVNDTFAACRIWRPGRGARGAEPWWESRAAPARPPPRTPSPTFWRASSRWARPSAILTITWACRFRFLRLPDASKVGVLEMGMNHAGEIRALAAIAQPEMGVVTNVGYAHVEFFDSIEGVAAAKRELIEGLPRDGVAVLNGDDARVLRFRDTHPGRSVTFGFSPDADVRAEAAEFRADGTRFRVGVDYDTGLVGRHAVMNLLAAIAVGREFGIPAGACAKPSPVSPPVKCAASGWSIAAFWCGTIAIIPIPKRRSR
jgi:UDP-N-acetylmuramoyl-tripeptide--D-alanyl-D-alanine ligase